jgi:hypothetical protein
LRVCVRIRCIKVLVECSSVAEVSVRVLPLTDRVLRLAH